MTYRPFIPHIAGALVVLVCAAALTTAQKYASAEYFARALYTVGEESVVSAGGSTYTVSKGVVEHQDSQRKVAAADALPILQLAYAQALARRAPLLALPGNDPKEIREVALAFANLADKMAAMQNTKEEQRLTKEALYPTSFLMAMADAEEARQAFLTTANQERLSTYLAAQERALGAYRRDAARFIDAFEVLIPHSPARFSLGEVVVTRDDMRRTLSALQTTTHNTEERLRERRLCIEGSTAYCDPLELELIPPERRTLASVSAAQRAQPAAVLDVLLDAEARQGITPLITLSKSSCIAESIAAPQFVLRPLQSVDDGSSYRKALFVGDLPLLKSTDLPDVPFYRYFAEHNVVYIPTSPILHYVCLEAVDDIERVLAVDNTRLFAAQAKLSGMLSGEEAATMRNLERALSGPTTERDARAYVSFATELARGGYLEKQVAYAVIEHMLSVRYNTAGWIDLARQILDTDTSNVRIESKGVPVDLAAAHVFFFRSPILFLFMAHNSSVSAGFTIEGAPASAAGRNPYLYFSQMTHTPELLQTLRTDISIYRKLHREAADVPAEAAFELY